MLAHANQVYEGSITMMCSYSVICLECGISHFLNKTVEMVTGTKRFGDKAKILMNKKVGLDI